MTADMPKQIWAKEQTRKDGGMYWSSERKGLESYSLTSDLDAYTRVAGMMAEALKMAQDDYLYSDTITEALSEFAKLAEGV